MDFRWSDWKGSNQPQGGDDMVDVHIVPGMKYITDFKWYSINVILSARGIFVIYLVTVNVSPLYSISPICFYFWALY